MRNRLTLPTRLLGLLSILLFAGVGVGFSMLDAVRFHGRGHESSGRDHYDPAGGCRDHSENCVLVFSGATDRAAPLAPAETRFAQPITNQEPSSGDPAVTHAVLLAPSSRAPPFSLA
jgi:hypothetical protein